MNIDNVEFNQVDFNLSLVIYFDFIYFLFLMLND